MQSSERVVVTGHRADRLASRLCDVIGEFLYDISHTVVFRFGAYTDESFRNGHFGNVPVMRCVDHKFVNYLQRSISVVRNALKHHHLEKFEVCIVDAQEVSLFSLRVSMRQISSFQDEQLKALDSRADDLRRKFAPALLALQTMKIPCALMELLQKTPTRPRIRLLTTTTDCHGMKKISCPPMYTHVLMPWSDPVENDFNQLIFTAFMIEQT
ncbi:unnamed protein product [Auanema sp. JU1783]|nr:unnamed protein product [Auanema sp. JU1783]